MKKYIFILIVLFAACQDDENALVFNNDEINGVAYLKDSLFESDIIIAPNVTVFLHDGDDSKNYLLKTDADKNGKFRFIFKPGSNEKIKLVSEYRDSTGILFSAKTNVTSFKDSLILKPSYAKGTIKVRTNGTGDSLVSGMDVYVFSNLAQATAAQKGSASAAIRAYKSNDRGVAFFYGLETGDYFVLGKKDLVTATPVYTVTVSAEQADEGWIYRSTNKSASTLITSGNPLVIALAAISPVQFQVTVVSQTGQPLSGVDVYLFSSIAQANSVAVAATNFLFTQKTDSKGIAEFRNVVPGDYYLAASGKFLIQNDLKIGSVVSPTKITVSSAPSDPLQSFPLLISL